MEAIPVLAPPDECQPQPHAVKRGSKHRASVGSNKINALHAQLKEQQRIAGMVQANVGQNDTPPNPSFGFFCTIFKIL